MPSGLERPEALIAALMRRNITPQTSGQQYFANTVGAAPSAPQMTVGDAVTTAAGIAPGIGDAMDFDAMRSNWRAGNYGLAALAGLGLIGLPLAATAGAMRVASSDAPGLLGRAQRPRGGLLGMFPDQAGVIGGAGPKDLKRAVAPSLADQGFDTSKKWYKGLMDPDTVSEPRMFARQSGFPTFGGEQDTISGIKAFYASDPETANRFAAQARNGGAVFPVHLRYKSPLIIDAAGKRAGDVQFGKTGAAFQQAVQSGKYDAIIIKNTADEGDIVALLKGGDAASIYE